MDLQSMLGYAYNSPFRNSPYLDIQTPEGLITMENTPIDLLGVDNLGNVKKMKAGKKNPYKFPGNQVREIPMQTGGRPPIRVTDPNDPRILAYQDSLAAHNQNVDYLNKTLTTGFGQRYWPIDLKSRQDLTRDQVIQAKMKAFGTTRADEDSDLSQLDVFNKGTNSPNRATNYVRFWKPGEAHTEPNLAEEIPMFQKPVQPYLYQKRPIRPTDVGDVNYQEPPISVQGAGYKPLSFSQTPTKYSLTYRDESSPTKDKTIYFDTIEQWRAAVSSPYYKALSTEEGNGRATASGYKLQTGGEVQEVKNFYTDYLNSPKYTERLKGMGYENPTQTRDNRLAELQGVKVTNVLGDSSRYLRDRNLINFDADERRKYGISRYGNAAHEFSHPLGAVGFTGMTLRGNQYLNPNEIAAFDNGNNKINQTVDPHDWHAGETKADMDTFRFFLNKAGIYNTGTQDFNKDFLNKARQNKDMMNDFNVKRFLSKYSDDDVVRLMNTIAASNTLDNPMAQSGGYNIGDDVRRFRGFPDLENMPYPTGNLPSGLPFNYQTPPEFPVYSTSSKKGTYLGIGADVPNTNAYLDLGAIRYAGDMGKSVMIPSASAAYGTPLGDFGVKWDPEKRLRLTYGIKFKKGGNNPYQQGGMTSKQMYDFLFDDEEEPAKVESKPTAPSTEEVDLQSQMDDIAAQRRQLESDQNDLLIQNILMNSNVKRGNPYASGRASAGINPYVTKTENDVMNPYGLTNLGIWGDEAHQLRQSDHNTGDAQDFGFSDPNNALSAVAQLQKEAKQRNIKYIIFNGKIWNPSVSNEWRPYDGPDPHNKHFHVSYNR